MRMSVSYKSQTLLLLLLTLTCSACSGLFFYPAKEQLVEPSKIGIPFQDVYIDDGRGPKLHAWFLPSEHPIATVIHLHGNAENISTHLASVYWMPAKGIQVLTLDYRGYGLSEGETTIDGVHLDAERVIDFALQGPSLPIDRQNLIFFGQSLGGAVALYTTSKDQYQKTFKAVVAESPFSSYQMIAQEKLASFWLTYPFQWPLKFLVTDQYAPIKIASKLQDQKILLIHETKDFIVPFHHSKDLCEKIGKSCSLWVGEGVGHIKAFESQSLRDAFVSFVQRVIAEP